MIGTCIKAPAWQFRGFTIRANQHSASWRRLWWVSADGNRYGDQGRAVIAASGCDSDTFPVSFPSLRAACDAIAKATGASA